MTYHVLMYYPICDHEVKVQMNAEQRNKGIMVDMNDTRQCMYCIIHIANENEKERVRSETLKLTEMKGEEEGNTGILKD